MEDSESLPLNSPGVLRNLLRETYTSSHPTNTLTSVLSFYDVTLEQLRTVCGTIYRANQLLPHSREAAGKQQPKDHPLKATVRDILDLLNPHNKTSPEAYKINLVYVATSIPHLWCKEVSPVVMLDPKNSVFFPYSRANVAVEFVWLHFNNKTHETAVVQMSDGAPIVSGQMLVYDDEPTEDVFSLIPTEDGKRGMSNVVIRIGPTETVVTCNEDDDLIPPSHVADYMILFTRGNAFYRLAEAILVQPSENNTLPYPLCLHKL